MTEGRISLTTRWAANEEATLRQGADLAKACQQAIDENTGILIGLEGQLGAGKTTFARGFLRYLGIQGPIKSPTYTLVETYLFQSGTVCHFDLYRLQSPQELEWMGIEDYFVPGHIGLVEWPRLGNGYLPERDITCVFSPGDEGRYIQYQAHSSLGKTILQRALT